MGLYINPHFYINPTHMSKEHWLLKHYIVRQLEPPKKWTMIPKTMLPVCLYVTNELDVIANICPNEYELNKMKKDDSPKVWFFVEIDDLLNINPELIDYIEL